MKRTTHHTSHDTLTCDKCDTVQFNILGINFICNLAMSTLTGLFYCESPEVLVTELQFEIVWTVWEGELWAVEKCLNCLTLAKLCPQTSIRILLVALLLLWIISMWLSYSFGFLYFYYVLGMNLWIHTN